MVRAFEDSVWDGLNNRWILRDSIEEEFLKHSLYSPLWGVMLEANFLSEKPRRATGDGGEENEDWIKNKKTGEYEWRNEVTSKSNTPKGYKYIGPNGEDIIKDLFTEQFEKINHSTGLLKMNLSKGKYSIPTLIRITTRFNVSLRAIIKTTRDENGVISKEINGIEVNATAYTSYLSRDNILGIQQVQLSPYNSYVYINGEEISPTLDDFPQIIQGGVAPSLTYSKHIGMDYIYNHRGIPSLNINFIGRYIDKESHTTITSPYVPILNKKAIKVKFNTTF